MARLNSFAFASESFSGYEPNGGPMETADEVMRNNIGNLEFDFFECTPVSQSVLECYGEVALRTLCKHALHCGMDACSRFLGRVQKLYYENPYHNAIHATQVCHGGSWLAKHAGLSAKQTSLERASFVIAALCHDVKHFGRTNTFCVTTQHALAVLYNDLKVLENMHAATCFSTLHDDEKGTVLDRLNPAEKVAFRGQIVELILSTDMTEHFSAISKSRVRREAPDFNLENAPDRLFLAQMCLKGGDICHSALPWKIHKEWSSRVATEFFMQGDEERRLGLPMSPLCDRETIGNLGKSQRGFLDFVCLPLFEELAAFGGEHLRKLALLAEAAGSTSPPVKTENLVQQIAVNQLRANGIRWIEDTEDVDALVQLLGVTS